MGRDLLSPSVKVGFIFSSKSNGKFLLGPAALLHEMTDLYSSKTIRIAKKILVIQEI